MTTGREFHPALKIISAQIYGKIPDVSEKNVIFVIH